MKIVIPLAGPDFVRPDGTLKAKHLIDGNPLLLGALMSRPWWRCDMDASRDYIFVLHDSEGTRRFADADLKAWFPHARTVFLAAFTKGAALSAAAGVAAGAETSESLVIDLADILFHSTLDVERTWLEYPQAGAIGLTFTSQSANYSYLRRDAAGHVVEAAEKRVISDRASAGVYIFRTPALYFQALAHSLDNADTLTFNGLFYVCPLFNGVLAAGLAVLDEPVEYLLDIKSTQ